MATLHKIKDLFRSSKEQTSAFKYYHYLNTLPPEKINEIVLFSESDRVCDLLPDVRNKRVLFLNDDRHKFVFKKILAQEPKHFVNFLYTSSGLRSQDFGSLAVFGDLNHPPFKKESFDVVVCPLALREQGFQAGTVKVLSGLVKNGGRLIVSAKHPQLEYLLLNQNPSQAATTENTNTNCFRILRDHHLFTEDMAEGVVDLSLKPFFSQEGEFDFYHDYKGTQISLVFRAVKFERKKQ